ncbi:MAG: hypothetical protein GC168_10945 [Candidatus Hydrogenedens sp.]|nr:hypothetical protein [Candidatus Hydrogenedens sp.]
MRGLLAIGAAALVCVAGAAQGPAAAIDTALRLLNDFESTATYHHVRLNGIDAARRIAAERLLAHAREVLDSGDEAQALCLFGHATEFPTHIWYSDFMDHEQFGWVLRGREAAEAALGHPLPEDLPVPPAAPRPPEARAPSIPAIESEPWALGLHRNRIDLANFPDRPAQIEVALNGEPAGRGRLTPPDKFVYARPGVGEYAITVTTPERTRTYRYPALSIEVTGGELLVNGLPFEIQAAAWDSGDVSALRAAGVNAVVLACPEPEVIETAQAAGFATIVRPLSPGADWNDTLNRMGGSVQAAQELLRRNIARYAATGAVWLWDLGLGGTAQAEALERALGPVVEQCDPLERPRYEAIR